MGWEKDYEYWRDKGHTWGAGVDDIRPLTEKERAEEEASQRAYEEKVKAYTVVARKEYVEIGVELEKSLPPRKDIVYGNAPLNWREEHSKKKLDFCEQAAKSLGYSFGLFGNESKEEGCFAVAVDFYGYIPDRGGNIHRYAVAGIKSLEDCLQLVADFSAIGNSPTTYYGAKFHYSTRNTAELRMELERWGVLAKPSLETQIKDIENSNKGFAMEKFADRQTMENGQACR